MIGPAKALSASRMATEVWVNAAGIDDDARGALAGAVNPVDDLVFAIALMELDREPELLADAPAVRLDVGERLAAVDLRLALAEQVEIGSVQDNDDRVHGGSPLNMSTRRPRPEGSWARDSAIPLYHTQHAPRMTALNSGR